MSESEEPQAPRQPPVLATLLQLLRLRGSPADLPGTLGTLLWLLALDSAVAVYLLTVIAPEQPIAPGLMIGLALHLLLPWILLRQMGHANRFVQTVTAITGTEALLTALMVAVGSLESQPFSGAETTNELDIFLRMVFSLAFIWQVVVIGHIYRCALNFPLVGGILVALSMMVGQAYISAFILGVPA